VHDVYVLSSGAGVLLVATGGVSLCRGPLGQTVEAVALHGAPMGPGDFDLAAGRLAVPTSAGVELVSILPAGRLKCEVVWSNSTQPARAVRFAGEGNLAVLADAVYVAQVSDALHASWKRAREAEPEWNLLDWERDTAMLALASRDGRVAVYRGDKLQGTGRLAVRRLEELRLSGEDGSLVAIDDRGLVTGWADPRGRAEARVVFRDLPTAWTAAPDGSTVLLGGSDGRVVACRPGVTAPQTLLRPRLFGTGGNDLALAVSGNGARAVIRDGTTLRFVDLAGGDAHVRTWNDAAVPVPGYVALRADGEVSAVLARSHAGDQQRVLFLPWPASGAAPKSERRVGAETRHAAPGTLSARLPSYGFVGAAVRAMIFVPPTGQLLVARSNGDILLLSSEQSAGETGLPPEPWSGLESPATAIALSRTGEYLAAAGEDGLLRILSMPQREVRWRIGSEGPVSALAFSPRDDVLMVRTADGTVRLFDPATGESIADWRLPGGGERPLAAWIGEADAMLLGHEGAVHEHDYAQADKLIERSRPYARQRQLGRLVAEGDFTGAWAATAALCEADAPLGWATRLAVLEAALRRAGKTVPAGWAEVVLADAPPPTYLCLGHAAYDGEQFDRAREWLHRGRASTGEVDALSVRRLAECDYLGQAYDDAAAEFAQVLARPDNDPLSAPTIVLQHVAALMLGGHPAEAHQVAATIGQPDAFGRPGDAVAATSARIIARFITGIESESLMAEGLDGLLASFAERSLLFRDDGAFFAGELARQRGDLAAAAVQYQRCIDVSRDRWPANWSRYRLAQGVQNAE
jgi:hypothetical protein